MRAVFCCLRDVVVQQRGGMEKFQRGGGLVNGFPGPTEHPGRQDQHRRPQALAAGAEDVLCYVVEERNLGVQVAQDHLFHLRQVLFDVRNQAVEIHFLRPRTRAARQSGAWKRAARIG